MSEHTKGPWVRIYHDRVSVPGDTDGSKSIAHCYSANGYDYEANASLIAAAPDLLAACKDSLEFLEKTLPSQYLKDMSIAAAEKAINSNPLLSQLRAAINKATH